MQVSDHHSRTRPAKTRQGLPPRCILLRQHTFTAMFSKHSCAATRDWKHNKLHLHSCKSVSSMYNCGCLYLYSTCIHKNRFCKELVFIALKCISIFQHSTHFLFLTPNTVIKLMKYQTSLLSAGFSSGYLNYTNERKSLSEAFFFFFSVQRVVSKCRNDESCYVHKNFLKAIFGIHHWQSEKHLHRQACLSTVKGKILNGNLVSPFTFYSF